jgi:hypothetical protein
MHKPLLFLLYSLLLAYLVYCYIIKYKSRTLLSLSDYVTLIIAVPENDAERVKNAIFTAGGGEIGHYSHCSLSHKGIATFMPRENSNPHIGQHNIQEQLIEERIEIVCSWNNLENVCNAIKNTHPYEELVIDIIPIYSIGRKTPKK